MAPVETTRFKGLLSIVAFVGLTVAVGTVVFVSVGGSVI